MLRFTRWYHLRDSWMYESVFACPGHVQSERECVVVLSLIEPLTKQSRTSHTCTTADTMACAAGSRCLSVPDHAPARPNSRCTNAGAAEAHPRCSWCGRPHGDETEMHRVCHICAPPLAEPGRPWHSLFPLSNVDALKVFHARTSALFSSTCVSLIRASLTLRRW